MKAGTYTGEGINLKDGQTLLGDDQALSLPDPFGGPAIPIESASGARPTIHVTTAGDQGIDLAQNNTIHGINITTDAGTTGLDDGQGAGGNAVGNLNVSHMAISGAGQAVDIDQGGALNVTLDSINSTGGAEGVQLGTTVAGTALTGSFSGGTGAISGSTTAGFLVGDGAGGASTGGTAVISYAGTISAGAGANVVNIQDHSTGGVTLTGNLTHAGANGSAIVLDGNSSSVAFSGTTNNLATGTSNAINITNQSGGTVAFSGPLNIDATSGTGVNLGGTNTGATFSFSGGNHTIDTTGGNGFVATGGGTVNVTGTGNHINSGSGTALNIANTNIGGSGVTFHDISANGGTNGIVLNNTGTAAGNGGLTVTGTDGADADTLADNGTGGTIQHTTGDSISLNSTKAVSLGGMNITSSGNGVASNDNSNWIDATNVIGLTLLNMNASHSVGHGINGDGLTNLVIQGGSFIAGALDNDQANFNGVNIHNLLGTSSVTGATFEQSNTIQFRVNNDTATNFSGTPDTLTVSGTTWQNHNVGAFFGDHLSVNSDTGGNFRLIVNNSSGTNIFKTAGIGVQATAGGTNGKMDADISGVTSGGSLASGNNNTAMAVVAETGTGSITYDIHDNTSLGTGSVAIKVTHAAAGGTSSGKIHNNTITHVAGPGTDAIGVDVQGVGAVGGTGTVSIENNTITGNYQRGIKVQVGQGNPVLNATIDNNHLTGTDTTGTALQQIDIEAGLSGSGSASTLRLNMFSNDVHLGPGATYLADYRLVNRAGNTFQLQDFTGNGSLSADVQNWVTTVKGNSAAGTGVVAVTIGAPFSAFPGNIPTPPLLAAPGGVQAILPTPGETHLVQAQLDTVVTAAIAQWAHAGASAAQLAALSAITFSVADLAGHVIGDHSAGHIVIDTDAAGHGWFVDPTPWDNFEFTHAANAAGTDLFTDPTNAAAGHLDLLTAVVHEMGHELGLPDLTAAADARDLMHINLVDGERRLPTTADVAKAGGGTVSFAAVGTTAPADAAPASAAAPIGGHGGHLLLDRLADNFHFAHVSTDGPAPLPQTHAATDSSLVRGGAFDLSGLRSQFMRLISSMRCRTSRRKRVGSGLNYMTWSQRGTARSLPLPVGRTSLGLARMGTITSMRCPSARCWRVTSHSMPICTPDVTGPAHLDQLRPSTG